MHSRSLHATALAIALAVSASCSQGGNPDGSADVREAPDVSPSAAPGVAWRYAYEFQLPDDVIESVQEAHAAQCEALGVTRCRITGLRYSVSNDEAVSAKLEVKLAPDIARGFGKQAVQSVRKAGGRLSNTEFSGEDTGPALSQATRSQGELQSRIAEVERQLGNPSLKDAERAQLQAQLQELKSQLAQTGSTIVDTQEKLASTPMTFNYYGRGGISGFAGRNPLMDSVRTFVSSLITMINIVLQVLARLLPWALLLLGIYLLARSRFGRAIGRTFSRRSHSEGDES